MLPLRFLTREQTPLQPQKGIATKQGLPLVVQVQFSGGDYPDKILTDGSIEHIGEGKDGDQKELRGNAAMLNAIDQRAAFPVYEKIANKQYRLLGKYVARSSRFQQLDPQNNPNWRGYVFTLKPVWTPDEQIHGWDDEPATQSSAPPRQTDIETQIQVEMAAMQMVAQYYLAEDYRVRFVHREYLG